MPGREYGQPIAPGWPGHVTHYAKNVNTINTARQKVTQKDTPANAKGRAVGTKIRFVLVNRIRLPHPLCRQ